MMATGLSFTARDTMLCLDTGAKWHADKTSTVVAVRIVFVIILIVGCFSNAVAKELLHRVVIAVMKERLPFRSVIQSSGCAAGLRARRIPFKLQLYSFSGRDFCVALYAVTSSLLIFYGMHKCCEKSHDRTSAMKKNWKEYSSNNLQSLLASKRYLDFSRSSLHFVERAQARNDVDNFCARHSSP